jgi:hypothetical protein
LSWRPLFYNWEFEAIAGMNPRPVSVTIVACMYLAVGAIGLVYHFAEFTARHAFQYDMVWIELTQFVAILAGAFMLRRNDWARWIAVAWIGFHVILSAFHAFSELAIHCLLCAVICWCLFRPDATRYFRRARETATHGS